MVINKTKGLVALLMSLILSFAMLPSAHAGTDPVKFAGYVDENLSSTAPYVDGKVDPLVVEPKPFEAGGTNWDPSETQDASVAYCFNQNLYQPIYRDNLPNDPTDPFSGRDLEFTRNFETTLAGYAKTPRPGADQGVLTVIYNGYNDLVATDPTNPAADPANIMDAVPGLTADEFRYATQLAVWYWTYSYNATTYDEYLGAAPIDNRARIEAAYKMLTGQDASVALAAYPADSTLDIYVPSDKDGAVTDVQNLLGAKFVSPTDGTPVTPGETTTPAPTTEVTPTTSVVTTTPTVVVTETAPVVTNTVTTTAPAVTDTVTTTAPAVTVTATETQPDVTETTTIAASTVVSTTQEPTATVTETIPAVTDTVTTTAPAVTETTTEAPVTVTTTEPALTTTSVVAGTTVIVSTTEPAITETSTVPGSTVVTATTEPNITTTSTVPGDVVVTTETAPAVTTTTTVAPTTVNVTETAPAVTNTTTLPAETTVVTETLPVVTSTEVNAPTTTTVTESQPAVTETTVIAPTTTETVTSTAPAVTTTVPGTTVTETKPVVTTTVAAPRIGTIATDKADGDKVISNNGGIVVDTVAYEGLTPGTEYKMIGELMTKDGKSTGITATTTFVPTESKGVVTLEFTVPDNTYEGQALVVFEELQLAADGSFVAEHKDINDGNQTIVVQEDNGTVPEVPGSTDSNPWWKVLIPVALIGGGLLVLSNLGSSEGSSGGASQAPAPAQPAPAQHPELTKGIPADQAKQSPAKKMLASTGASVLGLSALAALMLALGLFFVAKRRES